MSTLNVRTRWLDVCLLAANLVINLTLFTIKTTPYRREVVTSHKCLQVTFFFWWVLTACRSCPVLITAICNGYETFCNCFKRPLTDSQMII